MNTRIHRNQEYKSPARNDSSRKYNADQSTFRLADNRPEAAAQRRLQDLANQSPQIERLMAFQEIANNSPQANEATQVQLMANQYSASLPIQQESIIPAVPSGENQAGLPNDLKSGIEQLSGYSMDDVKVHYNSKRPAQFQADAYAQGADIHLAQGQEKHLPHEAWHVVQQKQGRVKPTRQKKGMENVNDDWELEKTADTMPKWNPLRELWNYQDAFSPQRNRLLKWIPFWH